MVSFIILAASLITFKNERAGVVGIDRHSAVFFLFYRKVKSGIVDFPRGNISLVGDGSHPIKKTPSPLRCVI